MTKSISLFEFVSYKSVTNYITEFIRDQELLEATLNPNRLQAYNPIVLKREATVLLKKIKDLVENSADWPSFEKVIQPDYIALEKIVKGYCPELAPQFKELETLLAKAYPHYFTNRHELFNQLQQTNPDGSVLPIDPTEVAPTTTLPSTSSSVSNINYTRPTAKSHGESFDKALGLDSIRQLGN